jgi:rhamnogalacturonyl hydrolase YesR
MTKSIFEIIKEKADSKNRGVVYEAIETITEKTQRIEFLKQLIEYYKTQDATKHDPENIAKSNIGYVLVYYKDLRNGWYEALSEFDVKHPIFGVGY